jgi:uncharacterized membrane protein YhaH (DUF805 family)
VLACTRAPRCAADYQSEVSGPLLDRIDLHVEVRAVAEPTSFCRRRRRLGGSRRAARGIRTNAEADGTVRESVGTPDKPGRKLLAQAAEAMRLSARGYHRDAAPRPHDRRSRGKRRGRRHACRRGDQLSPAAAGELRRDEMNQILRPLRRYFMFHGRSSRNEFWLFVLFVFLGTMLLAIVDSIFGLGGSYDRSVVSWPYGYSASVNEHGGLLTDLFALAMLIPSLAVAVRRLHDSDHSGWWLLIGLVPVVGWIVLFVFYVQPSKPDTNRFGPPPAV